MANRFHLEIITPTEVILDEQIVHVRAPGLAGDFGVLAGHAPMMAGLGPGRLSVNFPDRVEDYAISGGYFEVHDNHAVVLAESCRNKRDIDLEAARRDLEAAQTRVDAADSTASLNEARLAYARARALVDVAEHQRS